MSGSRHYHEWFSVKDESGDLVARVCRVCGLVAARAVEVDFSASFVHGDTEGMVAEMIARSEQENSE
jgi:hypothetical protein